ncbi:MAG: hypothetical protein WBM62_11025 [Crocosphaera sp.]|jgi:hypothetical protein
MLKASALPKRYDIGKTQFYQWRNHLKTLGYDMEPNRNGQSSLYSDEQIELFDQFAAHIKAHDGFDRFPPATREAEPPVNSSLNDNPPNGLVHHQDEQVNIESAPPEEIYVDANPLEDIKEHHLNLVDTAAQHIAAETITTFNYLTADYLKHRDFSITGLAEQVNQSEQIRQRSLTNLMESPNSTVKKMLARKRNRRTQ